MTAVRVARGFTGRDRIVTFAGCYHGHADTLLGSAGVPPSVTADRLTAPYNQVPAIDERVACVIVEPVAANMGLIPPAPGFLDGLRAGCDAAGALLIFDEVITGFRVGSGGAQELYGITPDLTTFGKVIGGGLPLAALGGRAEVMSVLAPDGPVYQAGTLSGNPLATAAGLAVLERLDAAAYVQLAGRAAQLATGLTDVIGEAGLPVQVPVVGPLMGLFFAGAPPTDEATAKNADGGLYARFFHEMLDRGVALAPSPFEALFPSLAHTNDDIERTVDLAAAAARATAGATNA
jgi:glutamate-1-semialdehyde 2,1-aminomutase